MLSPHEGGDHHGLDLGRRGEREDRSGAALAELAQAAGAEIVAREVVADDRDGDRGVRCARHAARRTSADLHDRRDRPDRTTTSRRRRPGR